MITNDYTILIIKDVSTLTSLSNTMFIYNILNHPTLNSIGKVKRKKEKNNLFILHFVLYIFLEQLIVVVSIMHVYHCNIAYSCLTCYSCKEYAIRMKH